MNDSSHSKTRHIALKFVHTQMNAGFILCTISCNWSLWHQNDLKIIVWTSNQSNWRLYSVNEWFKSFWDRNIALKFVHTQWMQASFYAYILLNWSLWHQNDLKSLFELLINIIDEWTVSMNFASHSKPVTLLWSSCTLKWMQASFYASISLNWSLWHQNDLKILVWTSNQCNWKLYSVNEWFKSFLDPSHCFGVVHTQMNAGFILLFHFVELQFVAPKGLKNHCLNF